MTDAAKQYDQLRTERDLLRKEKGELSQEFEVIFSAEMDECWEQMTPEEQQAVEDSLPGETKWPQA